MRQKTGEKLEELLHRSREALVQRAPEHIQRLGGILRKCARNLDSISILRRFLRENEIEISRKHLPMFRDHLIVNRIDLQDLEPAARERLRANMLVNEDPRRMSVDYRRAVTASKTVPTCMGCRWFLTAPDDGDGENPQKSCAEIGSQVTDAACFGFTFASSGA